MPFVSTFPRPPVRRRTAALVAVVLSALALSVPRILAQPVASSASVGSSGSATFRSGTDLVILPVTVVDSAGRYVPNLQVDDFSVYEEGRRQTVTLFSTAASPLDLMFLLDTSGSMSDGLGVAQQAATSVLRGLREGDRAAVCVFNERFHIVQTLTGDATLAEHAIESASPSGGTALYEALYIAFRELARWPREPRAFRRQALVVLSDGEDTMSTNVAFDDVLEQARRDAVSTFAIVPAPSAGVPMLPALTRTPAAIFNMRVLADESGGRAFLSVRNEDLPRTYAAIVDELAQQYWLAYVQPARATSGFTRVVVRVDSQPSVRVRTRSGYYARAARSPRVPVGETR